MRKLLGKLNWSFKRFTKERQEETVTIYTSL